MCGIAWDEGTLVLARLLQCMTAAIMHRPVWRWYGMASVKWLTDIEVLDCSFKGRAILLPMVAERAGHH